jgi:hypothetical protein
MSAGIRTRSRGERAKLKDAGAPATPATAVEPVSAFAARAKAAWARLIRKVYRFVGSGCRLSWRRR